MYEGKASTVLKKTGPPGSFLSMGIGCHGGAEAATASSLVVPELFLIFEDEIEESPPPCSFFVLSPFSS